MNEVYHKVPSGVKKRIHVNQHHIKANKMDDGNRPVFTVKTYNNNYKGTHVVIDGPSELIYRPNKPLACGAKAWIITKADVIIYD